MKNLLASIVLLLSLLAVCAAPVMADMQRLNISSNKRFLMKQDGTPFFPLADTVWKLPWKLNKSDVLEYLQIRKDQKFNAISMVAFPMPYDGPDNVVNVYGKHPFKIVNGKYDPLQPLETAGYDYWDHLEFIISSAQDKGLYIILLPAWGERIAGDWGKGQPTSAVILDTGNASNYASWISHRFKNYTNIIWMIGGDRSAVYGSRDYRPVFREMAAGILAGNSLQPVLLSYHPRKHKLNSSEWFNNDNWLKFNSIQEQPNDQINAIRHDYGLSPIKPTWLFEGRYEDHYNSSDEWQVRFQAYQTIFAGGFGYTYGQTVVHMISSGWKTKMHDVGAEDMQHLYTLMTSMTDAQYFNRIPDQSLLDGDTGSGGVNSSRIMATRTVDGDHAMIYSANGRNIRVKMSQLTNSPMRARWFNPRNGEWTSINTSVSGGSGAAITEFNPPGSPANGNDYILVLDSENAIISTQENYRDIFQDTWVGTDDLGRKIPDWQKVGLVKTNGEHAVGIFYVTWHGDDYYKSKSPYSGDVSKVLKKDPEARLNAKNKLWQYGPYHWAEPELGYFLSKDKFVIWRDLSMLADAGVDVIILDVTNGNSYWDAWDAIFEVMEQMDKLGNKVPKFCFWTFNKDVITVVQNIYDKIYKPGKHKKFWYYWDKKPLMLYRSKPFLDTKIKNKNPHYDPIAKTDKKNPHYGNTDYTKEYYTDYSKEVKNFFTLRNMWWGYYEWHGERMIGTEDNWSFGYDMTNIKVNKMSPMEMVSKHNGKPEEAAVTPAQHATTLVGKSWTRENGEPKLNEYDLPVKTYVPWLGKKVENPEAYGIYFQERWDEALEVEPPFIYLNDWNEWIAGKYHPEKGKTTKFMGRDNTYFFVDQYNNEFNRGIQPMKDGYTDNYYMQMIENIRKYKGAGKYPVINEYKNISINGSFEDWEKVKVEFRDTVGDTVHRNNKGYGGLHYKETSGRNDIITCKVAVTPKNIYFMAETRDPLTPSSDKNWMLLLIDADKNPKTGWHGYDFLVNRKRQSKKATVLEKYDSRRKKWKDYCVVPYKYAGNKIEISIPRPRLNLSKNKFTFDFHWADNPKNLNSIIDFCTTGDSAPNRRFNYRCSFAPDKPKRKE